MSQKFKQSGPGAQIYEILNRPRYEKCTEIDLITCVAMFLTTN